LASADYWSRGRGNRRCVHHLDSRLVKLGGQSAWHTHENTDEIFILLKGEINLLYRSRDGGEEKCARVIGGELLRVPMRMEHCVVAEEGTEVLLLEGNDGVA